MPFGERYPDGYPYPNNTKAMDTPHHCPVCTRLYYPRHTYKLEQPGEILTRVSDDICVKSLWEEDWLLVYWHHPNVEPWTALCEIEEASPV